MPLIFAPDSVFLQRFLRTGGYYKGDIDGLIGPKSLAALAEFQADSERTADELGVFDKRSEASIVTMLLATQRAARKFLNAVDTAGLSAGLTVRIISGSRTFDEQNKLFEQGRTTPGDVVTNARGGQSNHNFGIAWDVGIFNSDGAYIDDLIKKKKMTSKAVDAEYKKVGALGKRMGLFWGGDWSKPDFPHFQMLDNDLLASIREKFVNGGTIV
jgi:peptidoglycan L-alanyl-D-glutamate endopeptidase CwlK